MFLHSHNHWFLTVFGLTSRWPQSIKYQCQKHISRPTVSDVRGITQVSVPHLRNPSIQNGRRSSSWIMQNPFLRLIENHHLHWFNMIESYKHDTIPQCIWKPCRHQSYRRPMCILGILVIFGGHRGFHPLLHPHPIPQHQKRIPRPKINGISGITLVSVLYWSKSRNSTNPRSQFGGHLGFGHKMTPKHNFNTRNGFVTLKLVGLEVLL